MTTAAWGCRARRRLARVLAVARVEMLHLVRDRATIALVVTVPAVQVLLFGYAVNLDPRAIPVAIAREHADPDDRLRRAITGTGYFSVLADGLEPGAAARMVAEGRALVGIELAAAPVGADPNASSRGPRIVVDAADAAAVRPALAALETAYWRALAETAPLAVTSSVSVERLYNPDGRTAWTIVPGLAGVVVMISMLMLGALTLVRERERGSWETLLATPVDAADALVGKLAPYVAIGTVQAAVVIGVARLLFGLPVTGDVAALLAAVPLYAAAHLILGFAFSALAASQMQAIQGAVFFYLPSMLLSGFMFPFHGMPAWAQAIGNALPLTHFVRATRGVLLRGAGGGLVVSEMLPVALFTLVATAAALLAYRRRLD
jgi:ABC-2 type transport system permease protein